MTQIRKYAFDREFSPEGAIVRERTMAPKRLTPEECDALCTDAYERGKKDALAAAERDIAAAVKDIAAQAQTLLAKLDHESRAMRVEATRIALTAARKIADSALDEFGAGRAVTAVESVMENLRHQPRLLVKVSEHNIEQIKPRIEEACAAQAYGGAVIVRADAALRSGAVSIDWGGGVLVSDPNDMIEKIQLMIDASLAAGTHE